MSFFNFITKAVTILRQTQRIIRAATKFIPVIAAVVEIWRTA